MTIRAALIAYFMLFITATTQAEPLLTFRSPVEQTRFISLTKELRCPKCQNQDLADSQAGIAADLRRQIYQMLEQGKTDQEIVDYMVSRYGDFVLYRPRYSWATSLLWLGPVVFIVIGATVFLFVIRRNSKRNSEVES